MMRLGLWMAAMSLAAGCGDDGTMGVDAGPGDAAPGDSAQPMDAGSDAGESSCPPPPADLPTGLEVFEDGPFRRIASFPLEGFRPRTLSIYLPEGYDGTRRYPVIYFTDGQAAFASGYRSDQAMEALVDQGVIEPHIIVALYSVFETRLEELTPDEDPEETMGASGAGDELAGQMVDRVKAYVDANYLTRCGRENTTIAGFSLGGLMCLHMLMRDPDVWGRGLCMSPSFWWHGRSVLDRFESYSGMMPVRLWIDVGTGESWSFDLLDKMLDERTVTNFLDHVPAIRAGRDMAVAHGMTLGEDLGYYEAIDMPHTPMAVGARISSVLAFALSDEVLAGMTPTGSAFHVWHDQIEAPPPTIPATGTTTISFETRYADPFVLTWPNEMVTLRSRDEGIATIDAGGLVQSVAAGTATFEASFMGQNEIDTVEVIAPR